MIEPLFGITDPRTDKRIDFIGGGRGLGELERRVASGEMAVAFALYPTQMADLMAVADAGGDHAAEIHLVRAQARRRHGQPRAGLSAGVDNRTPSLGRGGAARRPQSRPTRAVFGALLPRVFEHHHRR